MADYLQFHQVEKIFPGVKALENISFSVQKGSVNGLMGENGAGKSTLLKILSGASKPTSGELSINGNNLQFHSTKDAIAAGISVIYQELNLVPEMSVAENLLLGHMPMNFCFLDKKTLMKKASEQLKNLAGEINPHTKVKNLSIGQRQMVEIAKALMHEASVIAFDEPTSSLSEREVKRLFQTIRSLKEQGKAIIYVSHRMEEVFEICDTITVFRDGKLIKRYDDIHNVTHDMLVADMVGRPITNIYNYRSRNLGETLFEVEQLEGKGITAPLSFSARKKEIIGVFGLIGAGRTELMKLIFHAEEPTSGKIKIEGKEVHFHSIRNAIDHGVMLCPEDRKYEGIVPIATIMENINISVRRNFSWKGFFLNNKKELANAEKFVDLLRIKTPSLKQKVMNLSGGNQQKVILARWLSEKIKVLLMDEPTRGIDVGAKNEIYNLIYDLAEQGLTVVVVSSDLSEILGISDRILVMREGQITADIPREQATQEKLLSMALPVAERS